MSSTRSARMSAPRSSAQATTPRQVRCAAPSESRIRAYGIGRWVKPGSRTEPELHDHFPNPHRPPPPPLRRRPLPPRPLDPLDPLDASAFNPFLAPPGGGELVLVGEPTVGRIAVAARQRLALLLDASGRIGTTLDMELTGGELAEIALPDFAQHVAVDLASWVLDGEECLPPGTEREAAPRRRAHHPPGQGPPLAGRARRLQRRHRAGPLHDPAASGPRLPSSPPRPRASGGSPRIPTVP